MQCIIQENRNNTKDMTDRIERLLKRVEEFHPGTAAELEEFRIKVLGRKGELNELIVDLNSVV